jgi:hypothetical protein
MTKYYITYQWIERRVTGTNYTGFGNSTISADKLTEAEIEKLVKTLEGKNAEIHPISITKLDG